MQNREHGEGPETVLETWEEVQRLSVRAAGASEEFS